MTEAESARRMDSTAGSAASHRTSAITRREINDILEHATVFQRGLDGTIRYWNNGCYEMYGWSPEEALGKISHELLRTVFPEPLEDIQDALIRDRIWRGELRHRRKNGDEIIVASKWTLPKAPSGDGLVVEVNSDITALERAEADQSRLAAIVESSDLAIISKTLDGIVTSWNRAAEDLFGYRAAEIIGQPISSIADPRNIFEMREILERIRRGEKISHFETTRKRKDGSLVAVSLSVSPILDKRGNIIGASKIVSDITEAKAREHSIRTALREKETLLREIHHRVKNNLQVISSLLDLQAGTTADGAANALLIESKNRVHSMAVIHQMLYQSGNLSEVDVRDFIDNLAPVLAGSYQVDSSRVAIAIRGGAVMLPIDAAIPCGLIVNELVSNALKHGFPDRRRGEITIELGRDADGRVRLVVCDDGVGMPDAVDLSAPPSLGLQLIVLLGQQLKAEMSINRRQPTCFSFLFGTEK